MNDNIDTKLVSKITNKMQIAKYIILHSEKLFPRYLGKREQDLALTLGFYTGVDKNIIDEILKTFKTKKTFTDWYQLWKGVNEGLSIDYETIRQIIIDQYVNKLQIPTREIICAVITSMGLTCPSPSTLHTDLHKLGFIWKRLHKSNKYILIERREQVAKRLEYLYKIKKYRDSNRILVYVERTRPFHYSKDKYIYITGIIVVASPTFGLIDVFFLPKHQSIKLWFKNNIHKVPSNSVFVIEQSKCLYNSELSNEPPNMHSKKMDMMKWLDTNNIPYEPAAHKAELYTLIEKYKHRYPESYAFSEILTALGHDVIVRPPELAYTKYFNFILDKVNGNTEINSNIFKAFIVDSMKNVKNEEWLEQDQILAAKEKTILEEEQKLELITDMLLERIQDKDFDASDFAECDIDEFDSDYCDTIIADATLNKENSKKLFEYELPDSQKSNEMK